MALNLGFTKSAESYVSTSLPSLRPYEIYDVKFDGFEDTVVESKKEEHKGEKYQILKIKFKNESGQYQHSLFAPKEGDDKRRPYKNANGHEGEFPSNVEDFTLMIGHVLSAINPDALNKLVNSNKNLSYEQLVAFLKKATDPKIGTETKIKLVADSKGRATFPKIASVFEVGGEAVITNNCVGDKLGFTPYELGKKEEFNKAKPTNMASVSSGEDSDPLNESPIKKDEKDDLDFEL